MLILKWKTVPDYMFLTNQVKYKRRTLQWGGWSPSVQLRHHLRRVSPSTNKTEWRQDSGRSTGGDVGCTVNSFRGATDVCVLRVHCSPPVLEQLTFLPPQRVKLSPPRGCFYSLTRWWSILSLRQTVQDWKWIGELMPRDCAYCFWETLTEPTWREFFQNIINIFFFPPETAINPCPALPYFWKGRTLLHPAAACI